MLIERRGDRACLWILDGFHRIKRREDGQGGEQPANNSWERADDEQDDEIFGLRAQIARWICQQLLFCLLFFFFLILHPLQLGMVMIHFHSALWKRRLRFSTLWLFKVKTGDGTFVVCR